MKISLVIPGNPIGWARTRLGRRRSGRPIPFTPSKQRAFANRIRQAFRDKYPNFTLMTGPLEAEVLVFFPIPKSASKKRRYDMRWGITLPERVPDWDNCGKIFSDALNGLAYKDDRQICSGHVDKKYDDRPRMEFKVRPVGEEP